MAPAGIARRIWRTSAMHPCSPDTRSTAATLSTHSHALISYSHCLPRLMICKRLLFYVPASSAFAAFALLAWRRASEWVYSASEPRRIWPSRFFGPGNARSTFPPEAIRIDDWHVRWALHGLAPKRTNRRSNSTAQSLLHRAETLLLPHWPACAKAAWSPLTQFIWTVFRSSTMIDCSGASASFGVSRI